MNVPVVPTKRKNQKQRRQAKRRNMHQAMDAALEKHSKSGATVGKERPLGPEFQFDDI